MWRGTVDVMGAAVVVAVVALLITAADRTSGQELNVIPDILRPYLNHRDELLSLNFAAAINERLFHIGRTGHYKGI